MVSTGSYCIGTNLWEIDVFEIVRLLWDSESIVKLLDGYEKVIYLNTWIYVRYIEWGFALSAKHKVLWGQD